MSWSALAGILWVLAASVTAMLPMRRQYPPGITLLILAPLLIIWLSWEHGVWIGLFALAAFMSMFRNPLIYFWKRWRGLPVNRPEDPPS